MTLEASSIALEHAAALMNGLTKIIGIEAVTPSTKALITLSILNPPDLINIVKKTIEIGLTGAIRALHQVKEMMLIKRKTTKKGGNNTLNRTQQRPVRVKKRKTRKNILRKRMKLVHILKIGMTT